MSFVAITPPQTAYDAASNISAKHLSSALEKALTDTTLPPSPPSSCGTETPLAELEPSLTSTHGWPASTLAYEEEWSAHLGLDQSKEDKERQRYEEEWSVYLGLEGDEWEDAIKEEKERRREERYDEVEKERYDEEWSAYLGLD